MSYKEIRNQAKYCADSCNSYNDNWLCCICAIMYIIPTDVRLDGRLERLEKAFEVNRNATANQKKVCEPVDICAMEAAYRRMTAGDESGGRDLPDADILKIIESMAKRFRRDINFNAATCPEYERMDENAREGLGRKWIEYVTGVINELDSLKA